jgi:hypothetical protein
VKKNRNAACVASYWEPLSPFLLSDPLRSGGAYLLRGKVPSAKPRLNEVLRQIALLGGFIAHMGNGEPGFKTISLGLKDVDGAVKKCAPYADSALNKFSGTNRSSRQVLD